MFKGKKLSLFMVLVFAFTVIMPVGAAFGASGTTYGVLSTPAIDESDDKTAGERKDLGGLLITIDELDGNQDHEALFSLPSDFEHNKANGYLDAQVAGTTVNDAVYITTTSNDNEFKLDFSGMPSEIRDDVEVLVPFEDVYVEGDDGDITLTIDNITGQLPSGEVVIGYISGGDVHVSVTKRPIITDDGTVSGPVVLRLKESLAGSLEDLVLTLPDACAWEKVENIEIIWGDETLKDILTDQNSSNGEILFEGNVLKLNFPGSATKEASCLELALRIGTSDQDALSGNVIAPLSGESNVSPDEIVVAYSDQGFEVEGKLKILDSSFNSIDGNLIGKYQYYLGANVTNNSSWSKEAMVIMQIMDADGNQVHFNVIKGTFNSLQTSTYYSLFTPPVAGNYKVNIFVWSNWVSLGGQPLADKQSFYLTVN